MTGGDRGEHHRVAPEAQPSGPGMADDDKLARADDAPDRVRDLAPHIETLGGEVEWRVCATCETAAYATVAQLRAELKKVDPEGMVLRGAQRLERNFDPTPHIGHDVVRLRGRILIGARRAPAVAAYLEEILPGGSAPITKFTDERTPVSPRIVEAASELRRLDLFDQLDAPADARFRVGGGKRREDETVLDQLARAAVVTKRHTFDDRHFVIDFVSGMQLLQGMRASVKAGRHFALRSAPQAATPEGPLDDAHVAHSSIADVELVDLVGEHVLNLYAPLMGHVPEVASTLQAIAHLEPGTKLPEMFAKLPRTEGFTYVHGDLMVLQYWCQRRTALAPEVESYQGLFQALEALGYPRLAITADSMGYQRVAAIIKAIAHDLERVLVFELDFGPLVQAYSAQRANRRT